MDDRYVDKLLVSWSLVLIAVMMAVVRTVEDGPVRRVFAAICSGIFLTIALVQLYRLIQMLRRNHDRTE